MNFALFGVSVLLLFALMFVVQAVAREGDNWGRGFDLVGAAISLLAVISVLVSVP